MRALLAAVLIAMLAAACEDDSAYKIGKPLPTKGGPMDAAADGAEGGTEDGAVEGGGARDASAPDTGAPPAADAAAQD